MELFRPKRWLGLASGVVLLLFVLILDGLMVWAITQTGISLAGLNEAFFLERRNSFTEMEYVK